MARASVGRAINTTDPYGGLMALSKHIGSNSNPYIYSEILGKCPIDYLPDIYATPLLEW